MCGMAHSIYFMAGTNFLSCSEERESAMQEKQALTDKLTEQRRKIESVYLFFYSNNYGGMPIIVQ